MATFIWTPDFGAKAAYKPRVRVASFGDGYEQRQGDGLNARSDTWDLTFQNREDLETSDILLFLETRAGVEAFDWIPPNESTSIRVVCREWSKSVDRYNLNSISAQFVRVYEP